MGKQNKQNEIEKHKRNVYTLNPTIIIHQAHAIHTENVNCLMLVVQYKYHLIISRSALMMGILKIDPIHIIHF